METIAKQAVILVSQANFMQLQGVLRHFRVTTIPNCRLGKQNAIKRQNRPFLVAENDAALCWPEMISAATPLSKCKTEEHSDCGRILQLDRT